MTIIQIRKWFSWAVYFLAIAYIPLFFCSIWITRLGSIWNDIITLIGFLFYIIGVLSYIAILKDNKIYRSSTKELEQHLRDEIDNYNKAKEIYIESRTKLIEFVLKQFVLKQDDVKRDYTHLSKLSECKICGHIECVCHIPLI